MDLSVCKVSGEGVAESVLYEEICNIDPEWWTLHHSLGGENRQSNFPKENNCKSFLHVSRKIHWLEDSGVWVDIVWIEIRISREIVPCWEVLYFGLVSNVSYNFFLTYRNRKNESSVCFHIVYKALSGSTWWLQGRVEVFKSLKLGLL